MSGGYFKVYRKLQVSDLWLSEPFTRGQAWIDLIGLARHKSGSVRKRGIKFDVERGCVSASESELSARWKWSRGKVRRFLEELENEEQQIVQQKNNITSLIQIVNYDQYQGSDTADSTANGQQTVQQTDSSINKRKNEKKGKDKENVKKKNSTLPPTLDDVKTYFTENGYSVAAAIKAWNYYQDGNPPWTDSQGKPVKSWKQKMRGVWFKDENKSSLAPPLTIRSPATESERKQASQRNQAKLYRRILDREKEIEDGRYPPGSAQGICETEHDPSQSHR